MHRIKVVLCSHDERYGSLHSLLYNVLVNLPLNAHKSACLKLKCNIVPFPQTVILPSINTVHFPCKIVQLLVL